MNGIRENDTVFSLVVAVAAGILMIALVMIFQHEHLASAIPFGVILAAVLFPLFRSLRREKRRKQG